MNGWSRHTHLGALLITALVAGGCGNKPAADGVVALSAPLVAGTASWVRRAPGTTARPSGRGGAAVAYDPVQRTFIAFGGFTFDAGDANDTWQWDPTTATWTERSTAVRPAPRRGSFLFYDHARHAVLLFGGFTSGTSSTFLTDMWQLDPITGNWTDVTPPGPGPRFDCVYQCSGSYDPKTKRAFFVDGDGLWIWDGAIWRIAPTAVEPPITSPALAYDSARSRAVLSTASESQFPLHTWHWTPTGWTEASATNDLGARVHQDMVFDASRGSVVLFGGYRMKPDFSSPPLADTWEWDGNAWSEVSTAVSPPAIQEPALVYGPDKAKVFLFLDPTGDVWEYQVSSIPDGSACANQFADRCASGLCVDGVCCASACGGSNPNDCQACSLAAGGTTNGTCTPVSADHVCRPATGPCDHAETCTGSSLTCPADTLLPAGHVCRLSSANVCEPNGVCSGATPTCTPGGSTCGNVPVGPNVNVTFVGGLASTGGIEVQFSDVTQAGTAAFIETGIGPPPRGSFRLLASTGRWWRLGTSAITTGPVEVCFHYDQDEVLGSELLLVLVHDDGSGFVNVTNIIDPNLNVICGSVDVLETIDPSVTCPGGPPPTNPAGCQPVPAGSSVDAFFLGGIPGIGWIGVSFAQVVTPGWVAVTDQGAGAPPPGAFAIPGLQPRRFWRLDTTATFLPPVRVCVHYDEIAVFGGEASLMMVYNNGIGVVDITTARDASSDVICGTVDSIGGGSAGGGEVAGSTLFSAFSTHPVTVDGVLSPNEWADASVQPFSICGGTIPGRMYVKNDRNDLYVAVEVENATWRFSTSGFGGTVGAGGRGGTGGTGGTLGVGGSAPPPSGGTSGLGGQSGTGGGGTTGTGGSTGGSFGNAFLNLFFGDGDGIAGPGDNIWYVRSGAGYLNDAQNSNNGILSDVNEGGTNDLVASVTHTNPVPGGRGTYVIEYRGALDSTDDAHDFSLVPGLSIGFNFQLDTGDCEPDNYWPVPGTEATILVAGSPNGKSCAAGGECASGFCVDGVCCDTACGSDNPNDCQACAVAAGASNIDGVCTVLLATHVCREAAGICDVPESCNGTATTCPTDRLVALGTTCRAGVDVCDPAESCTGTSSACPANVLTDAGTQCRGITGACDVPESCDGANVRCPANSVAPAGRSCRAKAGECDVADSCDGTGTDCPDVRLTAGAPCASDSNACTLDQCDGTSRDCQHPAGNATFECRPAVNGCDVAETCGGQSVCPADVVKSAETCAPVDDADPVTGFLGWVNDTDPGQNPPGSVGLAFTDVGDEGTATVVESPDGEEPPAGFKTVGIGTTHYWQIETQETTFASLTICIRYDDTWLQATDNEMMLTLWHLHDGIWKDVTLPGFPDPNANLLCGSVTELSLFALLLPIDSTPPAFTNVPGTVTGYATSTNGASVTYTVPTAVDAVDGPRDVNCAPASGTTFAPGKTAVTCTAVDRAGNPATATFTVWVQYQAPTNGSFFLQPINPDGSSLFKRGSTIPVKFKLQGASAAIANLIAHLSVAKVSQGVSGTYVEADSTAACDGGDTFRYDPGAKQYIFNLSTKTMTTGTWSLRADLGDRVDHEIRVSLK